MSKWATPPDMYSDGCTWPSLFNDLLGRDEYHPFCRRHDFECRYDTHEWSSAREYLIRGMRTVTPWYRRWRLPIIYIGLWFAKKQCRDYSQPLPAEWESYRDRTYAPLDTGL